MVEILIKTGTDNWGCNVAWANFTAKSSGAVQAQTYPCFYEKLYRIPHIPERCSITWKNLFPY